MYVCIYTHMCVCVLSFQPCQALCNPMDYSPPSSYVHRILQASILEWVAMPSSRGVSLPGIKPLSLISPALAGGFFTTSAISVLHTHVIVSNAIFCGELCVLLICLLSSQLSNLHLWGRPPLQWLLKKYDMVGATEYLLTAFPFFLAFWLQLFFFSFLLFSFAP